MFNWAVIEIKKASSILDLTGKPQEVKDCWNIVFKAPIENEAAAADSFDGCLIWLEQHRVKGSEYAILEMFFVPPIKNQTHGN